MQLNGREDGQRSDARMSHHEQKKCVIQVDGPVATGLIHGAVQLLPVIPPVISNVEGPLVEIAKVSGDAAAIDVRVVAGFRAHYQGMQPCGLHTYQQVPVIEQLHDKAHNHDESGLDNTFAVDDNASVPCGMEWTSATNTSDHSPIILVNNTSPSGPLVQHEARCQTLHQNHQQRQQQQQNRISWHAMSMPGDSSHMDVSPHARLHHRSRQDAAMVQSGLFSSNQPSTSSQGHNMIIYPPAESLHVQHAQTKHYGSSGGGAPASPMRSKRQSLDDNDFIMPARKRSMDENPGCMRQSQQQDDAATGSSPAAAAGGFSPFSAAAQRAFSAVAPSSTLLKKSAGEHDQQRMVTAEDISQRFSAASPTLKQQAQHHMPPRSPTPSTAAAAATTTATAMPPHHQSGQGGAVAHSNTGAINDVKAYEQHQHQQQLIVRSPSSALVPALSPGAVPGQTLEWEINTTDVSIIKRLAVGGFAEVFLGRYQGTLVAVKRLFADGSDIVTRFAQEVRMLARLRHPNLILFMGYTIRPEPCIISEYMSRGSLFSIMRQMSSSKQQEQQQQEGLVPRLTQDCVLPQGEPSNATDTSTSVLPVRLQRAVAVAVARGMAYLHTRTPPILHLDLKSPNVLVDNAWKVKISDFGLSACKQKTFVTSGQAGCTPEWAAPEVLRCEQFNEKADVYSYGVVLWELLTGQVPWQELNPMQVVGAVGFCGRSLSPPTAGDTVLVQLCKQCIQQDQTARPSFPEIVSTLERAWPGNATAGPGTEQPHQPPGQHAQHTAQPYLRLEAAPQAPMICAPPSGNAPTAQHAQHGDGRAGQVQPIVVEPATLDTGRVAQYSSSLSSGSQQQQQPQQQQMVVEHVVASPLDASPAEAAQPPVNDSLNEATAAGASGVSDGVSLQGMPSSPMPAIANNRVRVVRRAGSMGRAAQSQQQQQADGSQAIPSIGQLLAGSRRKAPSPGPGSPDYRYSGLPGRSSTDRIVVARVAQPGTAQHHKLSPRQLLVANITDGSGGSAGTDRLTPSPAPCVPTAGATDLGNSKIQRRLSQSSSLPDLTAAALFSNVHQARGHSQPGDSHGPDAMQGLNASGPAAAGVGCASPAEMSTSCVNSPRGGVQTHHPHPHPHHAAAHAPGHVTLDGHVLPIPSTSSMLNPIRAGYRRSNSFSVLPAARQPAPNHHGHLPQTCKAVTHTNTPKTGTGAVNDSTLGTTQDPSHSDVMVAQHAQHEDGSMPPPRPLSPFQRAAREIEAIVQQGGHLPAAAGPTGGASTGTATSNVGADNAVSGLGSKQLPAAAAAGGPSSPKHRRTNSGLRVSQSRGRHRRVASEDALGLSGLSKPSDSVTTDDVGGDGEDAQRTSKQVNWSLLGIGSLQVQSTGQGSDLLSVPTLPESESWRETDAPRSVAGDSNAGNAGSHEPSCALDIPRHLWPAALLRHHLHHHHHHGAHMNLSDMIDGASICTDITFARSIMGSCASSSGGGNTPITASAMNLADSFAFFRQANASTASHLSSHPSGNAVPISDNAPDASHIHEQQQQEKDVIMTSGDEFYAAAFKSPKPRPGPPVAAVRLASHPIDLSPPSPRSGGAAVAAPASVPSDESPRSPFAVETWSQLAAADAFGPGHLPHAVPGNASQYAPKAEAPSELMSVEMPSLRMSTDDEAVPAARTMNKARVWRSGRFSVMEFDVPQATQDAAGHAPVMADGAGSPSKSPSPDPEPCPVIMNHTSANGALNRRAASSDMHVEIVSSGSPGGGLGTAVGAPRDAIPEVDIRKDLLQGFHPAVMSRPCSAPQHRDLLSDQPQHMLTVSASTDVSHVMDTSRDPSVDMGEDQGGLKFKRCSTMMYRKGRFFVSSTQLSSGWEEPQQGDHETLHSDRQRHSQPDNVQRTSLSPDPPLVASTHSEKAHHVDDDQQEQQHHVSFVGLQPSQSLPPQDTLRCNGAGTGPGTAFALLTAMPSGNEGQAAPVMPPRPSHASTCSSSHDTSAAPSAATNKAPSGRLSSGFSVGDNGHHDADVPTNMVSIPQAPSKRYQRGRFEVVECPLSVGGSIGSDGGAVDNSREEAAVTTGDVAATPCPVQPGLVGLHGSSTAVVAGLQASAVNTDADTAQHGTCTSPPVRTVVVPPFSPSASPPPSPPAAAMLPGSAVQKKVGRFTIKTEPCDAPAQLSLPQPQACLVAPDVSTGNLANRASVQHSSIGLRPSLPSRPSGLPPRPPTPTDTAVIMKKQSSAQVEGVVSAVVTAVGAPQQQQQQQPGPPMVTRVKSKGRFVVIEEHVATPGEALETVLPSQPQSHEAIVTIPGTASAPAAQEHLQHVDSDTSKAVAVRSAFVAGSMMNGFACEGHVSDMQADVRDLILARMHSGNSAKAGAFGMVGSTRSSVTSSTTSSDDLSRAMSIDPPHGSVPAIGQQYHITVEGPGTGLDGGNTVVLDVVVGDTSSPGHENDHAQDVMMQQSPTAQDISQQQRATHVHGGPGQQMVDGRAGSSEPVVLPSPTAGRRTEVARRGRFTVSVTLDSFSGAAEPAQEAPVAHLAQFIHDEDGLNNSMNNNINMQS